MIVDSRIRSQQRLVVLMTCNTMERLDPAVLRKDRADLTCEFNYRFV
ncbi:MAG: AAA family ATPase [Oscillatoria sp. PMC 1068.18]|nr:AAA family ATPase [Oscillatoria sp. PMC 1068.18]